MTKSVTREAYAKKAIRMRKMTAFVYRFNKAKKRCAANTRHIDTSHGKVRVLEYGFDSKETAPLYIDLHGGGFVMMSAVSDDAMNRFFRKQTGVKIISIDYPKAPENPYPIALDAVYEIALHYINNADQYGIDPKHVGIGGHSAGGNLAAVVCMRARESGDLQPNFQILDYPPLDLYTDALKKSPKKTMLTKMSPMFNACYVDAKNAKDPHVSPVFAYPQQLTGLPPALIVVAGLDILHDEGVRYAKMLEDAGVDVELHDFETSSHGFTLNSSPESKRAHQVMADFIARHT